MDKQNFLSPEGEDFKNKNSLNEDSNKKVKDLEIDKNNDDNEIKTKIYEFGKYIGQLKNDKRHGDGMMYYNDGGMFQGFFKDDFAQKGIMYYNNGEIYEGEFKNTYRDGKGIYYFNGGECYEGDWKIHNKEGKGIIYYKNGERY